MASNGFAQPGVLPTPPNYEENGRYYHGYHKGKYLFPCDEREKERMDIYHKFFQVSRRDKLHNINFTPNTDPGPRILDLGTGTGIWAIDMADKYGILAEVRGVDLTLIVPSEIPENLTFRIRDIESPWHDMGLDSWDLIHMRMLQGAITGWPDLYQKIYRHLKPGFGWMEQVEIDMVPRCDDQTLPPDSKLLEWTRLLFEATAQAHRPMEYNTQTRAMLEWGRFVDISEEIIRVPLNSWPTDPYLKEVGRWYNLGLTEGLEALSLGPLTRVAGWTKAEVEKLCSEVKKEVCNKKFHVYCNMHIWNARRPNDA